MHTNKSNIRLFQNPMGSSSTIQSKLADLRHRIARATVGRGSAVSRPASAEELRHILGGQWLSEHCLLIEHSIPLNRHHGNVLLRQLQEGGFDVLDQDYSATAMEDLVFLDTETSGLNGGNGALVFLLGLARVQDNAIKLQQYLLTGFAGEKAMLTHACDSFRENDVVVSFNGKSFDLPVLESRCRLYGLELPIIHGHLDLLHFTRRAFSSRWPSCSLKSTERRLLAFHRLDDLPGARIPSVWQEFVRFGIWNRLPAVLQHNYWDVLSLSALLIQIKQVYEKPARFEADVAAIARYYVRDKRDELAQEKLVSSHRRLSHTGMLELANLYKRLENWNRAAEIWQTLAERFDCPIALESLAKYYEHQKRDYRTALIYARRLTGQDTQSVRHQQRLDRLGRRQGSLALAS